MTRPAAAICLAFAVLIGGTGCQTPDYPPGAPRIASDYGSMLGVNGGRRDRIHTGIDIKGGFGQEILAAADGRVLAVTVDAYAGPTVIVNHGKGKQGDTVMGLYTHLGETLVSTGEQVARGQVIARLGNNHGQFKGFAGVRHLHFGISRDVVEFYGLSPAGSLNPHLYWSDGPYRITCFEANREYEPGTLTYPVPCR